MRTLTAPLLLVVLGATACAARAPAAERTVVVVAEPDQATEVVIEQEEARPRQRGTRVVQTVVGAAAGAAAGAFLGWYTAALGCECSEHEEAFMTVGAAAGAVAGAALMNQSDGD